MRTSFILAFTIAGSGLAGCDLTAPSKVKDGDAAVEVATPASSEERMKMVMEKA